MPDPARPFLVVLICAALAGCGSGAPAPAPTPVPTASAPSAPGGSRVASPTDVTAFRGSEAEAGALGLRTFGFERTGRRGGADLWQNRATRACAAVVTEGGRFAEITMVPASGC